MDLCKIFYLSHRLVEEREVLTQQLQYARDHATELETVVCIHKSLHSQLREGTAGMDNNGYHSVQIRQNLRQLAFQIRVAAEGWIDGKTQLFVLLRLRGVRGEVQRQMATGDARWRMIDDAEKRSRI